MCACFTVIVAAIVRVVLSWSLCLVYTCTIYSHTETTQHWLLVALRSHCDCSSLPYSHCCMCICTAVHTHCMLCFQIVDEESSESETEDPGIDPLVFSRDDFDTGREREREGGREREREREEGERERGRRGRERERGGGEEGKRGREGKREG